MRFASFSNVGLLAVLAVFGVDTQCINESGLNQIRNDSVRGATADISGVAIVFLLLIVLFIVFFVIMVRALIG